MAVLFTFEDRAISGTSAINRPGISALMREAEARAFDVVVAEDVDRISHHQGDWHAARKRFDFLGIAVHTATGKVGKLDGALRALMGEMFIENLVVHVRRGMDGVIRSGRRGSRRWLPSGSRQGWRIEDRRGRG
jgi:site-specific DNA recombinase